MQHDPGSSGERRLSRPQLQIFSGERRVGHLRLVPHRSAVIHTQLTYERNKNEYKSN